MNGTGAQITNVDGSSTNIDSYCFKDGITLDASHLASVIALGKGITVQQDLTGDADATQRKRVNSVAALYAST